MVKIEYIIIAVIGVLIIAGIGFVAYDQGLFRLNPGEKPADAASTGTVVGDEITVSQPVTAKAALASVEADPKFTDWRSGKTTVFVSDVSSGGSLNGLSTTWAFTYVSNDEQAIVVYDTGHVANLIKTPMRVDVSLVPRLALNGTLDSDRADQLASGNATANGKTIQSTASIELSTGAKNTSNWDVIYRVTDGYYKVRLDAASGTVLDTRQYNLG